MSKIGIENNQESDFDLDLGIKGVELPQVRGCLILYFLDLMDGSYQEREWVKEESNTFFAANIEFPFDMFFNELDLQKYFDKKEILYNWIGEIFKNEEEVEALHEVSKILYKLCKSCYYDDDFFASSYLEPMRKAAGEAFAVFMENEKDNKDFVNLLLNYRRRENKKT